jgi:GAF domain-containing protein
MPARYRIIVIRSRVMTDYNLLAQQIKVLAEDEPNFLPVLSNASALLYENMEDLNWAGFYLMDKGSLLLGPFQGKVACIRIELGKGVCGTAAGNDETQLVKNVHEFAGHIACDSASNSEIVVPIHKDGKVVAVLDIDSPSLGRFTEEDKTGLEGFVKVLEEVVDFSGVSFE